MKTAVVILVFALDLRLAIVESFNNVSKAKDQSSKLTNLILNLSAYLTSGVPLNSYLGDVTTASSGNTYYLFTRNNPTIGQVLNLDKESVLASHFNSSWSTVAVCHGYTQSQNSELNRLIRDAYLGSGDFNVIILDWSHLSHGDYPTAILSVPSVGQGLGSLLLLLEETGASLETVHVVGFSLGAHVAGNAGRQTGGRVGRVTGLDPFSPIWLINSNRISSTDGIYVECIHTYGNEGVIAWGDADFYVNGGGSQPGCILSVCSHNRSWQIFAATVTYNHLIGRQCSSSEEIVAASCWGPELRLGNNEVNKTGSGLYYVSAGRSYPY